MFTRFTGILALVLAVLVIGAIASDEAASKTGRITGTITDKETGDPVIGASIQVVGTTKGAMTDFDGRYVIKDVLPGTYTLKVTSVSHNTVEIQGVVAVEGQTVEVSQALERRVCELDKTISVSGTVDIIDRFTTENKVTFSTHQIKRKPVQDVDALLQQVPGVTTNADGEVFIRGGRAGEVTYIVDGFPIGDPLIGTGVPWPPVNGGTAIVNGQPFSAMFFKNYGVNPFVDTEDDHLSTFAIDVDDASFIMARSYLERGHLPPEDAVRTEEFVNHFKYDYEPPTNKAFSISIDGAPSQFGTKNVRMLRIGIKGMEVRPGERKPANLVFVVDVSGSMDCENRLGLVRNALEMLVTQLTVRDRVGIVVYGSNGKILLEPTSIEDKGKILKAIHALRSEGSTNAEEGLRLGYEMADRIFEKGKINRIILCSDGVANVGITGADGLLEQIKQYADKGITLSSIGFGMGNYNDILLEKLGNKGNGYYAYVDDLKEAKKIFVDNLTGNLQVIARDVKIQVDFDPEKVRSYRLLGYENRDVDDDKFRDDTEDGGEIGSGHSVTALYELKLHKENASGSLGKVYVRFKDPDLTEVNEVARSIDAAVFAGSFDEADDDFQLAAAAAEFSEILRKSYWAKKSDLKQVLNLATRIYEKTDESEVFEFAEMVSKAREFQDQLAAK